MTVQNDFSKRVVWQNNTLRDYSFCSALAYAIESFCIELSSLKDKVADLRLLEKRQKGHFDQDPQWI